jgi:hypothetical protein
VFDANSSDGSMGFLEDAIAAAGCPFAALLQPEGAEETSFAAGCNVLAEWAMRMFPKLKWLFLYETDNQLLSVSPLRQAVGLMTREPGLAAVGFTTERLDGRKTGFGCPVPTAASFVLGQKASEWAGLDACRIRGWKESGGARWAPCQVVYTSPLLVRMTAWRGLGGMDASGFPFTDSDVDLCIRALRAGWQLGVLDLPGVVHDNNASPSGWSRKRVMLFHQSRYRLLLKHGLARSWYLKPLVGLRHAAEYAVLRAMKPGPARDDKLQLRRKLLRSVWRGYDER